MTHDSPIDVGRFQGALDVVFDLPLATVGSRGLAHLVDLLIYVFITLALAAGATIMSAALPPALCTYIWASFVIITFVLYWGLWTTFEIAMEGQSPGKRLLGLRVVALDGSSAEPVAIMLRNLGRFVDFLPGVYGIGLLVMVVQHQSRRVGDLLGGTVVVRDVTQVEAPTMRNWPSRFSPADVALLESFFDGFKSLDTERQEPLADKILQWLKATQPDFVGEIPPMESSTDTIFRLFGAYSPTRDHNLKWLR